MKKINNGQKFKNYKALCEFLEEPVKTGKSKQLQMKDWERYFQYHKEGNSIVIDMVYENPKQKYDARTSNNIKNCIFRKNCASVPEERSAIPLQTEQSSAG